MRQGAPGLRSRRHGVHIVGPIGLLIGVVSLLAFCGPSIRDLIALRRDPQGFVDAYGADHVVMLVVGAVLWLVCAWLIVGVGVTLAGLLPGATGRSFDRIAALIAPRIVRVGIATALGISLSLSSTACAPASATPSSVSVVATESGAAAATDSTSTPTPDWPVAPSASATMPPTTPPATPSATPSATPQTQPAAPQPAAPPATPADAPSAAPTVVVAPGQCLWDIVKSRMPANSTTSQIAAEVVVWWHANADIIGDNPNLVLPGEVLTVPAG